MRVGIRTKLLAGFVATALFTGVLGWYAVGVMERLNNGTRTMYGDVFGGTHLLGTYIDDSWQARSDMLDYLLSDDGEQRQGIRQTMQATDAKLQDLVHRMDEADTDREDVQTLAGIDAAWQAYAAWRDSALAMIERGDRAGALASYRTDGVRLARILDLAIDAFLDKKHEVGINISTEAEATYEQTRRIAIILSATAAGFGLLIGFFLSSNIARAVRQVALAAKGLARGNLNQQIGVNSGDEIGDMAAAFREMVAYQQEMARVANAMARGDLSQEVDPKDADDVLGNAFRDMTRNLRQMVSQLDHAARIKGQFVSMVSHEIRTPLNGIIGMAGLMLDGELTPELRSQADAVRRSGEVLLAIINDILDFSKVEAGKMDVEWLELDVREVVNDATELLAERSRAKGVELLSRVHPAVPRQVVGDPGRLRQVLVNLVSNAVKFTDRGGQVLVRARPVSESDGTLLIRFEVEDTGIGLEPEACARLFEPFSQADGSTSRKYGGTGLGLAICKRLVELMGGEIGVDSKPGWGSTFWFTVPFALSRQAAATPEAGDIEGCRVLIVDCSAEMRKQLEEHFRSWRMLVDSACDSGAALDRLRSAARAGQPYDLAVVDRHLPVMDAFELARTIRADASIGAAHLVLLQTFADLRDQQAAQAAGFSAALVKPVKPSQLFDVVLHVLAGRQTTPEEAARPVALPQPAVAERSQPVTSGTPLILVVEDNPINQQVACGWLRKLGYRADVAANGFEALESLRRISYAAVLMDCQMPEMDGFEATAEIRRQEGKERHTPIIAMTANAMRGDRERCLAAGMDDYISKPVRLDDLDMALRRWLPSTAVAAAMRPTDEPEASPALPDDDQKAIDTRVLARLQHLNRPGRQDMLSELIAEFLEDTPARLSALRRAAEAQDATTLREVAHALKGAAAHFGASEFAAQCQQVEDLARSGDLAKAGASVDQLEGAFKAAAVALESVRRRPLLIVSQN